MRMIDADAYKAEMKKRQEACVQWRDATSKDDEMYIRAEQSLATFIEAALTLEKMPTIEAMPIAWLKEKRKACAGEDNPYWHVLIEWQNEKEGWR